VDSGNAQTNRIDTENTDNFSDTEYTHTVYMHSIHTSRNTPSYQCPVEIHGKHIHTEIDIGSSVTSLNEHDF
jgi:hypothetical protein